MKTIFSSFKQNHAHLAELLRSAGLLVLASFCLAAGMELFLAPNDMNAGGFLGIAQIIDLWAPSYLYLGILYVLVNIPVMILTFFFFSRTFFIKTVVEVILTGGLMTVMRAYNLAENWGLVDIANRALLALAGGALTAIGIALTLSDEGSAGGTDILALMLQKKFKMSNVIRMFLIFDLAVITVYSLIQNSLSVFFYSFTGLAFYQITLELVFNSFTNAVMFEIITDDCAAMVSAIDKELHRGATMFKAVGTYTKNTKEVVICVVRKRQETKAREIIRRIAPDSFAYTFPIKEVIGKGFKNINF
jgi:uncharacterized membrane-anchored protein YitT (DUF2179 family)